VDGTGRATASATARGHWQQRWNESPDFRARWREAVERLGCSDRATGRAGGRFCLKHTWFLATADAVGQVLDDGKYDDAPGSGAKSAEDIARELGFNITED
jgi:hypothetical protein